jgi:hypothetical protein
MLLHQHTNVYELVLQNSVNAHIYLLRETDVPFPCLLRLVLRIIICDLAWPSVALCQYIFPCCVGLQALRIYRLAPEICAF